MRDLVYKNLTLQAKKRKIISSSEIVDNQGVRSIIHRHFVCIFKEIKAFKEKGAQAQSLSVLRERNNREQKERFSCKIKGSICAEYNGKIYLIYYLHSLNINLMPLENNPLRKECSD